VKESAESEAMKLERVGKLALKWWEILRNDKGAQAQLRRCNESTDVFFCPAFHDLVRCLDTWGRQQKVVVAVMAGALAHVKTNVGGCSFAAQMAARKSGGEKARVSGLRFRRLIQFKKREALFGPLIRIVRLLEGAANVPDLAESVYYWGDARRREWACAYYEAAPGNEP